MIIQCSNDMLEKLAIQHAKKGTMEENEIFPEHFLIWHAALVSLNGKEAVVLKNRLTRYPILLYGLEKEDYASFNTYVGQAIEKALQFEGINKDVINTYVQELDNITYEKDVSTFSVVTNHELNFMEEYINEGEKTQQFASLAASRLLYKDEDEMVSFYPFKQMQTYLEKFYDTMHDEPVEDIIDVDHYVLKIELNLEGHSIWRRVSVPATFSFKYLHDIIQIVFDWHDFHKHQFLLETSANKPLVIVAKRDENYLRRDDPSKMEIREERFIALKDVFATNEAVTYTYDFEDGWEHTITLETVERKNQLHPIFLNGKGIRPPEDIGGPSGFEHYLEVIRDESHPEYMTMKLQTEVGEEREQTKEQINRRLKSVLSPAGYIKFII